MDLLTIGVSSILSITGVALLVYSSRVAESMYKNFTSDYNPKKENTDYLRLRLMALGAFFFIGGIGNLIYQFKNWK